MPRGRRGETSSSAPSEKDEVRSPPRPYSCPQPLPCRGRPRPPGRPRHPRRRHGHTCGRRGEALRCGTWWDPDALGLALQPVRPFVISWELLLCFRGKFEKEMFPVFVLSFWLKSHSRLCLEKEVLSCCWVDLVPQSQQQSQWSYSPTSRPVFPSVVQSGFTWATSAWRKGCRETSLQP